MLEEQAASIAHKINVGGLEVNELDRQINAKRTALQAEIDDQSPVKKFLKGIYDFGHSIFRRREEPNSIHCNGMGQIGDIGRHDMADTVEALALKKFKRIVCGQVK